MLTCAIRKVSSLELDLVGKVVCGRVPQPMTLLDMDIKHVIAVCGKLYVEIRLKDLQEECAQCDSIMSEPVLIAYAYLPLG